MKKIAIGAAAMGGAALIAFGASGTFASFNDVQSVTDQSAGAGSLTLTAGRTVEAAAANLDGLQPGKSVDLKYFVVNDATSDVNGTISGGLTNLVDLENGCNTSEVDKPGADTDCGWNEGEFSGVATVTGSMTVGGTEASCAFNPSASQAQGTLASFATKKLSVPGVVTPGQGVCFVLRVELPSSASNAVQTDSATFGIDFRMDQAA